MDGSQLFRNAYKDGEKHEFLSKYFCRRKKDVDEDEIVLDYYALDLLPA